MVERHQRRVDPHLRGAALRRRVQQVYASYGHYYGESFRFPGIGPDELDARLTYEGFEHVDETLDKGLGPLMCLPHLGSWEWSAYSLTRVRGLPVTAVVERIEPPALFDWFVEFRERIGLHIVPLGPEAGRATVTAVKAGSSSPSCATTTSAAAASRSRSSASAPPCRPDPPSSRSAPGRPCCRPPPTTKAATTTG